MVTRQKGALVRACGAGWLPAVNAAEAAAGRGDRRWRRGGLITIAKGCSGAAAAAAAVTADPARRPLAAANAASATPAADTSPLLPASLQPPSSLPLSQSQEVHLRLLLPAAAEYAAAVVAAAAAAGLTLADSGDDL